MDALIFIDTNIFLDFYRITRKDVSLEFLKNIDEHYDRIITGSQVEMEYKKNRQKVILESIKSMKSVDSNPLETPAILADSQASQMLKKRKDEIKKRQKTLREIVEKIFEYPSNHDPVYKSLNNLFKTNSDYNLTRENEKKYDVKTLAEKRFLFGYPPRKKNDNSIGDAINWEWIIKCAVDSGKDIIIVTRDTDYGEIYNDKPFLNDWLLQEFKERVGKRRKIILTNRLSIAFEKISLPVTKDLKKEEERIIEERKIINIPPDAGSKFIETDRITDFSRFVGEGASYQ